MPRPKKSKLSGRDEVLNILAFIRDYQRHPPKRAVHALIRELRLAIRQTYHGSSQELADASDDYNATLAEAEVLLAVMNLLERDYGVRPSTYDSVARIDWEVIDHLAS